MKRLSFITRTLSLLGLIAWGGVTIGANSPLQADPPPFVFCTDFPQLCDDWAGGACSGDCDIQNDFCCT